MEEIIQNLDEKVRKIDKNFIDMEELLIKKIVNQ